MNTLKHRPFPLSSTERASICTPRATSSEPLNIPFFEDDDPFFTIPTKEWINSQEITLQQIYDIKGQIDGYNMYHSLAAKRQLGKDRITEWAMLLGYKPVLTLI